MTLHNAKSGHLITFAAAALSVAGIAFLVTRKSPRANAEPSAKDIDGPPPTQPVYAH